MHPYTRTSPAGAGQDQGSPLFHIFLCVLLLASASCAVFGLASGCQPTRGTPVLTPLSDAQPPPDLTNPRLAEMAAVAARDQGVPALTFSPALHHANSAGFKQRLAHAAHRHSWHIPQSNKPSNRASTILIVPQHDLHLLEQLEQNPEENADRLADAPRRPPSQGPLLPVEVRPDYYWTVSRPAAIFQAGGAAGMLLSFALAWASSNSQGRRTGRLNEGAPS